jgi:hypothetical protein
MSHQSINKQLLKEWKDVAAAEFNYPLQKDIAIPTNNTHNCINATVEASAVAITSASK